MEILDFKKKVKLRKDPEKEQEKINTLESLYKLFEDREKVLDAFKSRISP